jgi:hypothetical protein
MIDTFVLLVGAILRLFQGRRGLLLENLALRQQLAALKRRRPRPRLVVFDKLFWVLARRFWSGWKQALMLVTPETVVGWHRAGFRLYWKLISKVRRPIHSPRIHWTMEKKDAEDLLSVVPLIHRRIDIAYMPVRV